MRITTHTGLQRVGVAIGCLTLLLANSSGYAAKTQIGLTTVSPPSFNGISRLKPRRQPSIPSGFKELPYTEKGQAITATAAEKGRGYIIFSRPITAPVYKRTVPQSWERIENIATFATPGEYEPLTFSLYPLRNIRNMRLKISDLRSGKKVIGQKNLDLRAVTYWNIRYPMYNSSGTYRALPELLERVNSINLQRKICQRFWLQVKVPSNSQPGLYHGTVTLYESGSARALKLPITFRVLSYKLQRAPDKRYSAYYYHPKYQFGGLSGRALRRAQLNEFKTMQAYGIDMFPVVGLETQTDKNGKIQLYMRDEPTVALMVKAGFKGPIPLSGRIAAFYRKYVPSGTIGKHWNISKQPVNDKIYKAIEAAYRNLKQRAQAKGWPELICCPLDEVAPASAEFAAKVYAAVRRAGIKTYITKNPTAADSEIYRKYKGIDAWCSQPFAMPYKQVVADKRAKYWSYPNHSAGEMKNRVIAQKGGRMSYGYGLWRSGYSTLIPWHWRWRGGGKVDPFDYLRSKRSGCGFRKDENQQLLPPIYWECFREGYDDLRYMYTLQSVMAQRIGSDNPQCQELLKQGQQLIQEVWDSIIPQQKYLISNMWADETFQSRRWQLATLTENLLKFPAVNNRKLKAIQVPKNYKAHNNTIGGFIAENLKNGYIQRVDLTHNNYAGWSSGAKEITLKRLKKSNGQSVLQLKVKVDHKRDGSRDDGRYPVGWPAIYYYFNATKVDMTQYDYLYYRVKIDSNRSEIADDTTPWVMTFRSSAGAKYNDRIDLGGKQRVWLTKIIPLKQIILRSSINKDKWKNLSVLQFVIYERLYADKTELTFDLEDIAFLKFARPVIREITCAAPVILPAKHYLIKLDGFGFMAATQKRYRITLNLINSQGSVVVKKEQPMSNQPQWILNLQNIKPGKYQLKLAIKDKNARILSRKSKTINIIKGYL